MSIYVTFNYLNFGAVIGIILRIFQNQFHNTLHLLFAENKLATIDDGLFQTFAVI